MITIDNCTEWAQHIESLGGRLEYDGDNFTVVGVEVDTSGDPPTINYSTATKLKLKRKLQTIIENGSDLWSQLKAKMQQYPDMWDEWLITSDVYIDDPTTIAAYTAMNKDRAWMQNLINEIHAEQN